MEGSDFTSTLRVLLLDSVVVLGAGVACAGVAAAVGGACWHPASAKPKAVMATAERNLQDGFIRLSSFQFRYTARRWMAIQPFAGFSGSSP